MVIDAMNGILGSKVEVRDVIPSPYQKEYRHKIQYPIGQTKNSKRILKRQTKLPYNYSRLNLTINSS